MHCDMLKIQDGGAIVEKVNLIGPLILVATSFDISLINFTIISLSVKVDYICIFLERS